MVSVNPNPAQGFYFFDPMNMGGMAGVNSLNFTAPAPVSGTAGSATCNTTSSTSTTTSGNTEDLSKKIRKPYTITKSRESWTDQEHDKFLEALQLFDRDWKKIEAFVGSKTVIQIRSHAQKYFLKVQKSGTTEHVPPPRPKRKAAHPYPQKAPKTGAPFVSQVTGPIHSSSLEQGYIYRPDSSSALGNPITSGNFSSWSYDPGAPVNGSQANRDDATLAGQKIAYNCGSSSSNESTPRTWRPGEIIDREEQGRPMRVMPDFAQVYSFIGSVFDPNARDQLQRLKQMDPINLETAVLLMRNLSINLMSPEFENHRHLLASHDVDGERARSDGSYSNIAVDKLGNAITTV